MRLDKINTLHRSSSEFGAQQATFTGPQTDRENIMRASFVVSELIATKLKSHAEGEFVKECLVAAAKLLASNKGITDMAQDIEKTMKDTVRVV